MTIHPVPVSRRAVLAGFAAIGFDLSRPSAAIAQAAAAPRPRANLTLQAKPGAATLRPGTDTPVWSLQRIPADGELRFARGDELAVSFDNALPVPTVLNWRGLNAVPTAAPLLARRAVAPGGKDEFAMPLRQAGTFLCDTRLLGDGQAAPSPLRALVVQEREPVDVDLDQVVLIEDWRLKPNGSAVAPGIAADDAATLYTVNGRSTLELSARPQARLRLRFINGCQRAVIAIRIEELDVRVMAIDGQPAEPFLARNGQIVLAPGTRIDAFVDATRPAGSSVAMLLHDGKEARPFGRLQISNEPPAATRPAAPALPSNGLPAQLDLKNAIRVDLALGTASPAEWLPPAQWTAATAPAFQVKRNRTVVLALKNQGTLPSVLHLHGHHVRLLDRLDDGWKPFWLDTLAVDAGQTQRVAFLAEHAGSWLLESMATQWSAPRLIRSFVVT
jgi:FtsP/CotA-like multicopper oxidase with cupredoxin domain